MRLETTIPSELAPLPVLASTLAVLAPAPFLAAQQRLTFARCGVIDPLSL